jgi:hypothetical protein
MDEVAAGAEVNDHTKSIRDRLRAIMDLYKVSRYRPAPAGSVEVDFDRSAVGGLPRDGSRTKSGIAEKKYPAPRLEEA